jgi:hypothetical protein
VRGAQALALAQMLLLCSALAWDKLLAAHLPHQDWLP